MEDFDVKTWNGHTHTEFCPHGSKEDTEFFIKKAIKAGFKTYTITEHFPMPPMFYEQVSGSRHAIETAAMTMDDLPQYFDKMEHLKNKYSQFIKILVGFEVDFFEQFEDWTATMLQKYSDHIDDAILSVHFLPTREGLRAVDDSYEDFCDGALKEYQTPVEVANAYLTTILKAVQWSDSYKPICYGHITLYRKWIKDFDSETVWENKKTMQLIEQILDRIQENQQMLDCNMSGMNRESQQEPSPYWKVIKLAQARNIKLVYGADAHSSRDVNQGYQDFLNMGD